MGTANSGFALLYSGCHSTRQLAKCDATIGDVRKDNGNF